ncbi:MAG: UPF0182 family protein [Longimicrobiales bacterium]
MSRGLGRGLALAVIALIALVIVAQVGVSLYTDALWFSALGYGEVFWKRIGASVAAQLAAGAVATVVVLLNLWLLVGRLSGIQLRRRYGNLEIAEQLPRSYLVAGVILVSILTGWWLAALNYGGDAGVGLLAWLARRSWGVADPVFGQDVSFYVFTLPVLRRLLAFLVVVTLWSGALVGVGYALLGMVRWTDRRLYIADAARLHLVLLGAALIALLAVHVWLTRYDILFEGTGLRGAIGYTDVNARLPARTALAVITLAVAAAAAYGGWRQRWVPAIAGGGALAVGYLALALAYPALVQKLRVEPNQLAREEPYIRWEMRFTRNAWGIDSLRRDVFPHRRGALQYADAERAGLDRLPVWDPEPMRTVLNETQALFDYYRFPDVDYDRYAAQDGPRQVAIGVREFEPEGLDPQNRTWVSLHLNPEYMRGMGAVVAPAGASGPEGQPDYWLWNQPIRREPASPESLRLTQPLVYFGEGMTEYGIIVPGRDGAFTGMPGVDFPAGVRLGSALRLAAFAWLLGEKNLLLAGDLTADSRIIYRRPVRDRVRALAPFIHWDPDPYPVLADGRVVWILDGYTGAARFPLARGLLIEGIGRVRYLRNSVKATVDAVTGEVRLFAVQPDDPLLTAYRRVFPDLVLPIEALPEALRAHLRYPPLLLHTQSIILQWYHLETAEAFFAGQDFWQVAAEGGTGAEARNYVPSFLLMTLPGESRPEYVLEIPLVAQGRQNMTALLLARNDPPHLGELVLLELPRDRQVPGPTQVQSVIEQDPRIAEQLSLWRRSGSDVDVGHLRIVPLDSAFLYVVPLYLSASESAIPQIGTIVVSDGYDVAMVQNVALALRALVEPGAAVAPDAVAPLADVVAGENVAGVPPADVRQRALELMRQAEERLRAGDFAGFGAAWEELRTLLEGAEAGGGGT